MEGPQFDFTGKTVLVTGAASSIGSAIVRDIRDLGGTVFVHGRSAEALEQVLPAHVERDHHIIADLSNPDGLAELFASKLAGADLSGVVHCAGAHSFDTVTAHRTRTAQHLMNVNVHSPMQITKACLGSDVMSQTGLSLVWISSIAALSGAPGVLDYGASKAAQLAAVRSMARELAPRAVRVNAVAPGWVETDSSARLRNLFTNEQNQLEVQKYPLGIGRPEDVSNATLFLLSDLSRWVTGITLRVDGGFLA